jgi:hypothetical protein
MNYKLEQRKDLTASSFYDVMSTGIFSMTHRGCTIRAICIIITYFSLGLGSIATALISGMSLTKTHGYAMQLTAYAFMIAIAIDHFVVRYIASKLKQEIGSDYLDVSSLIGSIKDRLDVSGTPHEVIDVLSSLQEQAKASTGTEEASLIISSRHLYVIKHLTSFFSVRQHGFGYTPEFQRLIVKRKIG